MPRQQLTPRDPPQVRHFNPPPPLPWTPKHLEGKPTTDTSNPVVPHLPPPSQFSSPAVSKPDVIQPSIKLTNTHADTLDDHTHDNSTQGGNLNSNPYPSDVNVRDHLLHFMQRQRDLQPQPHHPAPHHNHSVSTSCLPTSRGAISPSQLYASDSPLHKHGAHQASMSNIHNSNNKNNLLKSQPSFVNNHQNVPQNVCLESLAYSTPQGKDLNPNQPRQRAPLQVQAGHTVSAFTGVARNQPNPYPNHQGNPNHFPNYQVNPNSYPNQRVMQQVICERDETDDEWEEGEESLV